MIASDEIYKHLQFSTKLLNLPYSVFCIFWLSAASKSKLSLIMKFVSTGCFWEFTIKFPTRYIKWNLIESIISKISFSTSQLWSILWWRKNLTSTIKAIWMQPKQRPWRSKRRPLRGWTLSVTVQQLKKSPLARVQEHASDRIPEQLQQQTSP